MTDDELEVESWRYSGRAFWVLPLSSGRIAILQPNRQPYRIVDDWELAKTVGLSAENFQLQTTYRERITLAKEVIDINTEDLDL
jgi:hypothetical protein